MIISQPNPKKQYIALIFKLAKPTLIFFYLSFPDVSLSESYANPFQP